MMFGRQRHDDHEGDVPVPGQPDETGARGAHGSDRGSGDSGGRPSSDPVLTQRFEDLDAALHGPIQDTGRRTLNWSGVNETTVAFDSITQALADSVPVDRPTSDLPQTSGGQRAGE